MNASSPTIELSSSTKFKTIFLVARSFEISKVTPYSSASFLKTVGACPSSSP